MCWISAKIPKREGQAQERGYHTPPPLTTPKMHPQKHHVTTLLPPHPSTQKVIRNSGLHARDSKRSLGNVLAGRRIQKRVFKARQNLSRGRLSPCRKSAPQGSKLPFLAATAPAQSTVPPLSHAAPAARACPEFSPSRCGNTSRFSSASAHHSPAP